jgi:hypothetical protein
MVNHFPVSTQQDTVGKAVFDKWCQENWMPTGTGWNLALSYITPQNQLRMD